MRQSLLRACRRRPSCWGPAASRPRLARRRTQSTTVTAAVGSPVTASGKTRIALLLPLSGRAAPIGQSLQQAAEMALFDTGAKDLALAAYDSGETAETAVEAYRKARTDGAALVLGPLFGTSATALAPLVAPGRRQRRLLLQRRAARPSAASGSWASPPRRRSAASSTTPSTPASSASPPSRRRRPTASRWRSTLESQVAIRGGTVVAIELFDANSADLNAAGAAPGRRDQGRGQARRPGAGGAAAAVRGAGRAGRRRHRQQVGAADRHRRVGRAQHRLGDHAARRLVCRARSGQARRLRAPVPVDLRPAAASPGDARLRRRVAGRPARAAEAGRRFLGRGASPTPTAGRASTASSASCPTAAPSARWR